MRPSAVTPVASTITSPNPPCAKRPRWTKCQSFTKPCCEEYWHMGATTVRLRSVSSRRMSGEKRRDICLLQQEEGSLQWPVRHPSASDDVPPSAPVCGNLFQFSHVRAPREEALAGNIDLKWGRLDVGR